MFTVYEPEGRFKSFIQKHETLIRLIIDILIAVGTVGSTFVALWLGFSSMGISNENIGLAKKNIELANTELSLSNIRNRPFFSTSQQLLVKNNADGSHRALGVDYSNVGTVQAEDVKVDFYSVYNDNPSRIIDVAEARKILENRANAEETQATNKFGVVPPNVSRNSGWVFNASIPRDNEDWENIKQQNVLVIFRIDYKYNEGKISKSLFSLYKYNSFNGESFYSLVQQFEL